MKRLLKYGKIKCFKKDIAIVVPLYKVNLSPEEKISINQLNKVLKGYPMFLAIPNKLSKTIFPHFNGFKKKTFKNEFFETYKGYNSLLKNQIFYSSFKNFKYILIYQTDCLVFKDNLLYFCNKNYDYIGAPWVKQLNGHLKFLAVGNGGLSLRKIDSFLGVTSKKEKFWIKLKIFLRSFFPSFKVVFHKLFIERDYQKYFIGCVNEDLFWSYISKEIKPDFKIADFKDALKFSIEKYPSLCFRENNNQLPFGCHAWQKYDKKFWEKFI